MISNINDISSFLEVLEKSKAKRGIRKSMLYPFIEIPLSRRIYPFDYDGIFEFCIDLGLFRERDGIVMLANHGLSLIDMEHQGLDLTDEQTRYIVKNCIFNNKKFSNVASLLQQFVFSEKVGSFIILDEKAERHQNAVGILFQFNVVRKQNRLWVVNSDYLEHVEQIGSGITKMMTQKQLDEIIAEQKRIGSKAEERTVEYEIKRLKDKKLVFESKHVKKISNKYVNKGYDVESFSRRGNEANLFIEVKGRKYNTSSFIISINEIKTAERLGDRYAIYFWNCLGSSLEPKEPFKIIRNPFKKLFFDKCKNCLNFLIEI